MEKENYILTQDTFSAVSKLTGGEIDRGLEKEIDLYFYVLSSWVKKAYPDISVGTFFEKQIDESLTKRVTAEIEENPNILVVTLDRFLLREFEKSFPKNLFRLQITRSYSGEKTSRQNSPPLEKQFNELSIMSKGRQIIVVDDGIFTGGTLNYVFDELKKRGIRSDQIKKFIGFIGGGGKIENTSVETIMPIPNLFEWIDIRDFGIFGGKKFEAGRGNYVSTSIPYLYPWSDGASASFDRLGNLFEISRGMIMAFGDLIQKIEKSYGRKILIRDLLKAGFPIPTNKEKNIPVTLNTPVGDYLENCIKLIGSEEEREVYIFDMDGTLYQLDGTEDGYSGSTLESQVNKNAIEFISSRERVSLEKAYEIFQVGMSDAIGLSAFLARRYGISRADYFDIVWDINPEGIIKNFETPRRKVSELSNSGKKIILLTSAPQIWQKRVVEYLGLQGLFESVYTGETFGTKEEIFKMLSQRYKPEKIVSIGDQEKTDIFPAEKYGIRGVLVKNPSDLKL